LTAAAVLIIVNSHRTGAKPIMRRIHIAVATACVSITIASSALAGGTPGWGGTPGRGWTSGSEVLAEARDRPWTGVIPACDDPAVLAKVSSRFAGKEAEYWNSSLTITAYDRIHTIAYRPWGASYIPRRFCAARAFLSDGLPPRPVYYSVREDLGIIGATWGVQFCVVGLDRNLAYAPECQAARP
jgi:hypothetical protein